MIDRCRVWLLGLICAAVCPAARGAPPVAAAMSDGPFVVVLGVTQDAGYPQMGCRRPCCERVWGDAGLRRHVACLAIVDPKTRERWMIDATPDMRDQLRMLDDTFPVGESPGISGILLTHAHIGHYTGLAFLGHEAMGADRVPVYAMPRMRQFLSSNGPWDQLVRYGNIALEEMDAERPVRLNDRITVTPFRVPHREEYTEVVGFRIDGPRRKILYIPDIDKWNVWDRKIGPLVAQADVAYLDGTFFDNGELPNRDMASVPHPFIVESIATFRSLNPADRSKIRFIHLNHTNPALQANGAAVAAIRAAGMAVAVELERQPL